MKVEASLCAMNKEAKCEGLEKVTINVDEESFFKLEYNCLFKKRRSC